MRETAAALVCGCLLFACAANKDTTEITKDPGPTSSSAGVGGNGAGGSNVGGSSEGGSPSTGGGGTGGDGGTQMGAPPTVVTANCSVDVGGQMWAVAPFAGKTAEQLARTSAFVTYDGDPPNTPAGHHRVRATFVSIRDGEVGAWCQTNTPTALSVTFVLPED